MAAHPSSSAAFVPTNSHADIISLAKRNKAALHRSSTYLKDSDSTTTIIGEENDESKSTGTTFVDFTPPADATILPPAKYKSSLLVFCLVYLAAWFAAKAGLPNFLRFHGWLSPNHATFLQLVVTVFTLIYGGLDVFREAFTFKRRGKIYGIGAWLRRPRSTRLDRYSNVFAEALAGIIHILEDGFAMFNAPPQDEERNRIDPKLFPDTPRADKQSVELRVEHRIDIEKLNEYEQWRAKIKQVAKQHARGLVSQGLVSQSAKRDTFEDNRKDDENEGVLFSNSLMFEGVDSLNEWMLSPRRAILMAELRDFLLVPNVERIRMDRDLPDAYTDLVSQQGRSVPTAGRGPKKWKVAWLTIISLSLSKIWERHVSRYYLEFWGLNNAHILLTRLVSIAVCTFLNSYIMVPLLLYIFAPWMIREKHEKMETKEPWRTLNEGLPSMRRKCALTFAFYGGCLITWLVKNPSFP